MKTTITWRNALAKLALASVVSAATYLAAVRTTLGDGCPTPSFAAAPVFDVGRGTTAAVSDFNGDGKPDLAVVTNGGVSVLLGNGDGTLRNAINVGTAVSGFLAVGDFNGDGTPDLAVARYGDGGVFGVSVLLGNGDATFQAAGNYAVVGFLVSVTVADFNGDGKPDLAVGNGGSHDQISGSFTNSSVSVLLGNGDGTFQTAVNYRAETNPQSVAAGDFNGDGKPDLAVTYAPFGRNIGGGVSVLLGNGDGTFQAAVNYDVGNTARSVAVGDFNGDGKPDLAVNNISPNDTGHVSILLGKGDGTFHLDFSYSTGADFSSLAVNDFNRDGKADIAVANHGNVSVLWGTGDGSFQTAVHVGRGEEGPFAVGDFNGDGNLDLAPGGAVLLGKGDGTFQTAVHIDAGESPKSVAVSDFNGDGKPDLAVANGGSYDQISGTYTNSSVSVLLNNGDGAFQTAVSYRTGAGSGFVAVSDFNGDGKIDLAVANSTSGNVSVLLGQGDGTFQIAVNYVVAWGPTSIAVGDFNGDGTPDLAIGTYGDGGPGPLTILLGRGDGTFQAAKYYDALGTHVTVGDFNGDGKPDLVLAGGRGGVSVLLGKGDGTFQTAVQIDAGESPKFVAVSDFNGDGKPDMVVANGGSYDQISGTYTNSSVSVLLNNGDGAFQTAVSYRTGAGSGFVAVGDFNGDGKPDLAVANSNGGILASSTVSVLLGSGDGTFQSAIKFVAGYNPLFVTVGDFTGDGKPDLAVVSDEGVSVLLNTCASVGNRVDPAIVRGNATITLSWPFPSTGFVLESTTNLNVTNWQSVVEVPTTNAGRWQVTAPINPVQRYFRLRKP